MEPEPEAAADSDCEPAPAEPEPDAADDVPLSASLPSPLVLPEFEADCDGASAHVPLLKSSTPVSSSPVPKSQYPEAQSATPSHVFPLAHASQVPPPQSVSDSYPFLHAWPAGRSQGVSVHEQPNKDDHVHPTLTG